MSVRLLLCRIVATFTGTRYFPEIKWAKKCWTHNVFRAWEWLVGRKYGVRCEVSAYEENGRTVIEFHTLEAVIAHVESAIRGLMPKLIPDRVYFPRLATPQGISFQSGVFMAVAYDSGGLTATNGLSTTINFTITGSGIMLVSFPFVNSNNDAVSTVVWNTTESLSKLQTQVGTGIAQYVYLFSLAGASTGAHSLVGTSVAFNHRNQCASYSGSDTTLDTSTKAASDNTATVTCSITTGVANTFISAGVINNSGDPSTSDGNVRQHNGAGFGLVDKACASAGANSVTNSGSGFGAGTDWAYCIASIKPPAAGPANVKTVNGLAIASVKTIDGLAIASVKTKNGLT